MRIAISAVIIEDGNLLLVRKKNSWILPGGKTEADESDLQCLSRELGEELSGTKIYNEKFYGSFKGRTPHRGDVLEARVYFADINGELRGVRNGDSISESAWARDFANYNLSDITSKIVDSLKNDGCLE